MPITEDQARQLLGGDLYGPDGKIGRIGQVFLDDETGQPEWVTVSTGLFGSKETFVPLQNAQVTGDGATVPYDKNKVKGAPNVDVDGGHLSQQEEADLYQYYGMGYGTGGYQQSAQTGTTGTMAAGGVAAGGVAGGMVDRDRDGVPDAMEGRTAARGTSGVTDDAMTRSEERLRVGTQRVEAGRVRLRKYIVTEQVQAPVTVTREQVRVEREPITEANMPSAMSGAALSEEEHEVVLTEERPVVEKDVVPVERVRLDKETVQETVTVQDQLRKEQIETVGGTTTSGTTTTGTVDVDADASDASSSSGGSLVDKAKQALDRDR